MYISFLSWYTTAAWPGSCISHKLLTEYMENTFIRPQITSRSSKYQYWWLLDAFCSGGTRNFCGESRGKMHYKSVKSKNFPKMTDFCHFFFWLGGTNVGNTPMPLWGHQLVFWYTSTARNCHGNIECARVVQSVSSRKGCLCYQHLSVSILTINLFSIK